MRWRSDINDRRFKSVIVGVASADGRTMSAIVDAFGVHFASWYAWKFERKLTTVGDRWHRIDRLTGNHQFQPSRPSKFPQILCFTLSSSRVVVASVFTDRFSSRGQHRLRASACKRHRVGRWALTVSVRNRACSSTGLASSDTDLLEIGNMHLFYQLELILDFLFGKSVKKVKQAELEVTRI